MEKNCLFAGVVLPREGGNNNAKISISVDVAKVVERKK